MKKILMITTVFMHVYSVKAQKESDTLKEISLKSVVISSNKFAEKKKNVSQKIDIISTGDMKKMNAQNTADVLINTGNVFVQKSQQGGGSPVLRGFEASRILLSIDGIRLNNAIYRSGHLQSIITVDNNALEKIEVLNGPGSTIHGSDALGGVVVMQTKSVKFGEGKKIELLGLNGLARYSSANHEKTGSIGFQLGNKTFGSTTQITYADFDDLVQGKNGVDSIMNLWKKKFIVGQTNTGADTIYPNPDPYKQVYSGYSQIDILQKFAFKPNRNIKHNLNLQLSNSSDVPRYDRLSETTNGVARNAEWYYGPQFRTLAAYAVDVNNRKGFFNDISFNLNHQFVEESRHNRGFKRPTISHRTEKIHVTGYTLAARHKTKAHELTMGTDGQFNTLKSTAFKKDIFTEEESKTDTRYPDGKNQMNLLGIYLQHVWKLSDDKIIINDGMRFDYNTLRSTLQDTSILFKLPFTELTQRNQAFTGNIGVVYLPDENLRFTANVSRGFRSPNFDDMTKVFESISGQRLIVPNANLKPEFTRNIDLGIYFSHETLDFNLFGFYTHYTNAIVTDVFNFNGQDSVLYDGKMTRVYANQNKAKAFIYGGGFSMVYRPVKHFSFNAGCNYTYGRFNSDTVLVPLDHVPPVHGKIGLKYEKRDWYTELYSIYNGKKKLSDYNPNGEDNLVYATPQGTPSWYTINWRLGITVAKYAQIQLGVENILDKNYRYFASGMSAAGRNAIVALRINY